MGVSKDQAKVAEQAIIIELQNERIDALKATIASLERTVESLELAVRLYTGEPTEAARVLH